MALGHTQALENSRRLNTTPPSRFWTSPSRSGMAALLVMALVILFGLTGASLNITEIPVGRFSTATLGESIPEGWESLTFGKKKKTQYELVEDDGTIVLRAISEGTASGLVREVDIDPAAFNRLTWRWKVSNVLRKGDVTEKSGDDFAARIYVTFDYSPKNLKLGERLKYRALRLLGYKDIPLRAINYVWSNKAPTGTIVPNAYTDWVAMIAVRSGSTHTNTWHTEERNLYDDYRAAFGEEPGRITGIALMTDTDDTGESAMAYFGDISLGKRSAF